MLDAHTSLVESLSISLVIATALMLSALRTALTLFLSQSS